MIDWKDDYSINVAEVDSQHKEMVDIVNQIHEAAMSGEDMDTLNKILNHLLEYTRFHFKTEEKLMLEHDYFNYASHKREHNELIQQLETTVRNISEGSVLQFSAISDFDIADDWMMTHLLGSDKALGAFLNSSNVF